MGAVAAEDRRPTATLANPAAALSLSSALLRRTHPPTHAPGALPLQVSLWVYCSVTPADESQLGKELSGCFLALVSAAAAFAFLLYGGRLWLMLRRFPIESRGRRKKLREVGLVTSICATCFLFR